MSKGAAKGKPKGIFIRVVILLFSLLYLISPVDLVSEVALPVVGWLDDIAIVMGSFSALLAALPRRGKKDEEQLAGDAEGE